MAQSILSVEDFDRILDDYSGRLVSHTPRTTTYDNVTGEESFTDGSSTNIKCHFFKMEQKWWFDKAARIEGGDAQLLSKVADNVQINDKITADGETYYIKDRIRVPGVFDSASDSPTFVYDYCNLFLVE